MATNLVSEVVEVLSPTIVSRIASGLGVNQTSTQNAITAAVPALVAALMAYVSRPQGASKLNDIVRKQEPGMLSSLASVIGESGQKALTDQGASVLTSLLGGKTFSALCDAVGQYAGIGGGSKSLMGLLGPVVLGVLGKEQRERGLDASGLATLLTAQKSNVLSALPSGFSKYLDQAGILDDVTGSVAKASKAASSPSLWPWLVGALLLLAIGAFLWRFLAPHSQEVAETPKPAQIEVPYADVLAKLRGVKVGNVDIGDLANSAITGLRSSLEGIKDETSAQAALPEITKVDSQFDQLRGLLDQLPPETRKTLADLVAGVRPSLEQLMDRVLAIPGVGALVKPTVDAIRTKLEALAKS